MPKSSPIQSTSTTVRYNLLREQFHKKVVEKYRVYLEHVDYRNKTMKGELKHKKVEPKVIRQYEDTSYSDDCVVNLYMTYPLYAPRDVDYFYCRPSIW